MHTKAISLKTLKTKRGSKCNKRHRVQFIQQRSRTKWNKSPPRGARVAPLAKSHTLAPFQGAVDERTRRLRDSESAAGQAECVSSVNAPCPLSSIPDQPFVQYGMDPEGHDLHADPREPTSQQNNQPASHASLQPTVLAGQETWQPGIQSHGVKLPGARMSRAQTSDVRARGPRGPLLCLMKRSGSPFPLLPDRPDIKTIYRHSHNILKDEEPRAVFQECKRGSPS